VKTVSGVGRTRVGRLKASQPLFFSLLYVAAMLPTSIPEQTTRHLITWCDKSLTEWDRSHAAGFECNCVTTGPLLGLFHCRRQRRPTAGRMAAYTSVIDADIFADFYCNLCRVADVYGYMANV